METFFLVGLSIALGVIIIGTTPPDQLWRGVHIALRDMFHRFTRSPLWRRLAKFLPFFLFCLLPFAGFLLWPLYPR